MFKIYQMSLKTKVAVPLRMSRVGIQPPAPAPKREAAADPEVLQKANEIIKDRSADCKPRKVRRC